MGYDDANWGATEWLAMSVMMLLFWGLLIGLVVWAVRTLRTDGERSARGEMDGAAFQRRRVAGK